MKNLLWVLLFVFCLGCQSSNKKFTWDYSEDCYDAHSCQDCAQSTTCAWCPEHQRCVSPEEFLACKKFVINATMCEDLKK